MSGGTVTSITDRPVSQRKRLAFLQCRTYSHSWEEITPPEFSGRAARWGFRFSLRCTRCGSERHDVIDGQGGLSVRTYNYAHGYREVSGEEFDAPPSRADFRLLLADVSGSQRR